MSNKKLDNLAKDQPPESEPKIIIVDYNDQERRLVASLTPYTPEFLTKMEQEASHMTKIEKK